MARCSSIFRKAAMAFTAGFVLASGTAAAQTVLKYSNWIPAQHVYNTRVIVPWTEDVARVTQGRVKVEILPKVVGSAAGQFEVVRDGLADVVTVSPGFNPGRYDVIGLGGLPMVSTDPRAGSVAFYHFYEKHLAPLNLFKGAYVLSAFTTSPGHVYTTKKPVRAIADFQGLKIRSPVNTSVASLRAVGSVSMTKPISEQYELLAGGVLDGTLAGIDQAKAMRLSELAKYVTMIPGGFYSSPMVILINEDAWNKISPADRKAIQGVSGQRIAERIGAAFADGIAEGMADLKAKGVTVIEASPEFVAELKTAFKPVEQATFEIAREAGVKDPAAALSELKAEVAERTKALAAK